MKRIHIPIIIVALAVAAATARAQEAKPKDAKSNWTTLCKGCHGETGKGDTKLGQKLEVRDYTDPKVHAKLKDEEMFKAIKEGLKKGDNTLMKPYSDKLSDAEIKALVAHMRSFGKK
jgi:cytochrome c553